MEAVATGDRGRFERTAHLVQRRCGRVAHIVKAEMREDPARYSNERRERIVRKVHQMESKCESSSVVMPV